MDYLQICILGESWLSHWVESVAFKYAETVVALISIGTAFIAATLWLWKKIIVPIGRALSHVGDMYSTHEFILSEIAKMQGVLPMLRELDQQYKSCNASLTATVSRTEALCVKANLMYEESPIARYECDMDGKCTWTNAALQKLWGLNADQLLGYGWLSGLHPDDTKRIEHDWMDTIKHWVPYKTRYRVVHPETGKETLVEAIAQVIMNHEEQPMCIWGKVTKVKQTKDKEE